jgi:hypothetical protein
MSLQNAYLQLMTKWAGRLGSPFSQYRPTSALVAPFSQSPIGSTSAIFDASESLAFNAPSKFNDPLFAAIVDPRAVQPGDYLSNDSFGIWYVASTEPLKPILCVSCNRIITVTRPSPGPAGDNFYGGDNLSAAAPILTEYPASVLNGTKGERTDVKLPGDVRDPWVQVLVTAPSTVVIDTFDMIEDDLGRNFIISAAEQSNLGWRITAQQAET